MERHEYSWSAMSGSTLPPPGALASCSSHTFVAVFGLSGLLVAHRFINMPSMSALAPTVTRIDSARDRCVENSI